MVQRKEWSSTDYIKTFRGINVDRLTRKLEGNEVLLMDITIIMVGTNNVEKDTAAEIKQKFTILIRTIKRRFPQTKIILSTILPRPRDHHQRWPKINDINIWLNRKQTKETLGFSLWKTHNPFIENRRYQERPQIIHALFHRDGLHLSEQGDQKLKQLQMAIATYRKP